MWKNEIEFNDKNVRITFLIRPVLHILDIFHVVFIEFDINQLSNNHFLEYWRVKTKKNT